MSLPCFVCPIQFDDINKLCKHIQNVHKIRGPNSYQCKLCNKILGELDAFKRHLDRCLKKTRNHRQTNHNTNNVTEEAKNSGVNLCLFEQSIRKAALQLALKLCSKMAIPRNFVFEIIEDCNYYVVSAITQGVENVIIPLLAKNDDKKLAETFVEICSSAFCDVETEHKLDLNLEKSDLIAPLTKFPIGALFKQIEVAEESDIEDDYQQSDEDTLNVSQQSATEIDIEAERIIEDDISDDSDSRFDSSDERIKVSNGTLMPIQFQLRKFFEMKDVFKTVMENTNNISKEGRLNHFINGSLWKSKLSEYSADQIVIPYHLYADETQINNALGTHCSSGLENCVYYSFPTIPAQFASRLENIFGAMLTSAADTKNFGPDACFERLVQELNNLAKTGIKINVEEEEKTIFFVLGLFLGDNASLNSILGFNPCSSTVFCKHCRLTKHETQKATAEDASMIRNEENYEEDLLLDDETNTGIKWNSIFNTIFLFHVTHSAGVDIMHDLHEGILRYNMSSIIRSFTRRKVFTLKTLNDRKRNFVYDHPDSGNKSADLTQKHLKKGKLRMTASEMMTFFKTFPLLVGDLIAPDDEAWVFYLKTVEVVDLVFLTSYTESDLLKLKNSIAEMNSMYMKIFNETLKPKHHFLTHYPRLIRLYGPLSYISSMRYEAKHRIIKKYAKNTESRKNISFSIGRKLQYEFAKIVKTADNLQNKLIYSHPRKMALSNESYFQNIENSDKLKEIAQIEIYDVKNLELNGIVFSQDLYIPKKVESGEIIVWSIRHILALPKGEAYVLCRKYSRAVWSSHYASYEVTELYSDEIMILEDVDDLLKMHVLPVSIHSFKGKKIFQLRYY